MIIGITGFSGSGKTRFSKELRTKVAESVLVISQDNYYKPSITGDPELYNFDTLEALDIDKLLDDIALLKSSKEIQLPMYDFVTHRRTGYQIVFPRDIIVLEGHLIFVEPRLRALIDLLIYIDVKEDMAFIRRLRRDIQNRGRSVESVVNRHERFIYDVNKKIVKVRDFADIVIPNHNDMLKAIDVIASYINSL